MPPPLTPATTAFYTTTATIIPVLGLALAVQGRAFEDTMQAAHAEAASARKRGRPIYPRLIAALLVTISAVIILASSFLGEYTAISDLYSAYETAGDRATVLTATLILIFAVTSVPVMTGLRIARHAWKPWFEEARKARAEANAAPGTSPSPPPGAETGKTSIETEN
jgi:hypothetical protein